MKLVGIPEPERRIDSYPYELSGGQRQRVMIAMALANEPDILIADEPTTALDVTIQAQILDLLADLQKRLGMAVVFITHDLGIVRRFADRVYVMRSGEVVETGVTEELFTAPEHPYTKMLLDAEPEGEKAPPPMEAPVLIRADNVKVNFLINKPWLGAASYLTAVNNVSLTLKEGQTIGIVGESGSGKSTLGRAILRLLDSEGRIAYLGQELPREPQAMRPKRRELQLVFQDPFGSLSPRMTVGRIITEGLLIHEPNLSARERDRRAQEALREVGLDPAMRNRYPHEFSGGQRQRIAIARTMILAARDRARRADKRARPFGAEADRHAPARSAEGSRAFLSLHQPRYGRRPRCVGLCDRDEERQDRRTGRYRTGLRSSSRGIYQGPHGGGAERGAFRNKRVTMRGFGPALTDLRPFWSILPDMRPWGIVHAHSSRKAACQSSMSRQGTFSCRCIRSMLSPTAFSGNPAAVLVLDEWLPDAMMLSIAQENNLAETAFVKSRPDGAWDLRWFAPAHEVDFCGHATLATAHVLFTKTGAVAPFVFHTRVGELQVSKETDGYRLDIPCLPPETIDSLPHEIAGIFPKRPLHIFRNFENIFVDLGSADAVRGFAPDLAAIALLGSVGLVVTGQDVEGQRRISYRAILLPARAFRKIR